MALKDSEQPELAAQFVDLVTGEQGQKVLRDAGFGARDVPVLRHPRWVLLPAAAGALLILLPLVGMLLRIDWAHLGELLTSESSLAALWLSLRTAVVSTALCVVLAVRWPWCWRAPRPGASPCSARWCCCRSCCPGGGRHCAAVHVRRTGFLGAPLAALGVDIAFSTTAVVLAQTFVALPFLVVSLEARCAPRAPATSRSPRAWVPPPRARSSA